MARSALEFADFHGHGLASVVDGELSARYTVLMGQLGEYAPTDDRGGALGQHVDHDDTSVKCEWVGGATNGAGDTGCSADFADSRLPSVIAVRCATDLADAGRLATDGQLVRKLPTGRP
jgi:hypothetical protein